MENRSFYNEILTDHNLHPVHKEDIPDANLVLEGLNPSCGDHIWLKLKVEDGIIKDGGFVGDGCAISQASADIMLDLIIGKKKEEAIKLAESFLRMIKGNATDEDMDALEEAVQSVVDGEFTGTVFNDYFSQSYGAAELAVKFLKGEETEPVTLIDYIKVTQENAEEILELVNS